MNPLFSLRTITKVIAAALTIFASGVVSAQTSSNPQVVTSGVAVGPLSGATSSLMFYKLTVPSGATNATFTIAGSSGDCDLYVKYGSVPSSTTWDYRPYTTTSNETVSVPNPAAGDWYIALFAYKAYTNLTLTATFQASATLTAATPSFSPTPGTYSGQVSVSLATATPNAVIRFTKDGSTPTTASENYTAPIIVSATTTIKAITYATNYTPSAVASGTYTIQNSIATLANNVPLTNLSGATGSTANFKFAVPPGQTTLTVKITGTSGDCDLYVKYGQLATTSVWDQRPYTGTSNETVTISNPAGGDYFIMLNGYKAYTGLTLTASYTGTTVPPALPDLTINAAAFSPRITTETFAADACEIQEGTITAGTHKLLRFNLETRNIGTGDLVLGNPATNPKFVWASCHGHYHFVGFAQYRLLNTAGQIVRTGQKIGFCLEDLSRWNTAANPSARYTCSNQGIQAGWSDIYSSSLSGQWIDITGLASGSYILQATVDPMNLIPESNENNNTVQQTVTIP